MRYLQDNSWMGLPFTLLLTWQPGSLGSLISSGLLGPAMDTGYFRGSERSSVDWEAIWGGNDAEKSGGLIYGDSLWIKTTCFRCDLVTRSLCTKFPRSLYWYMRCSSSIFYIRSACTAHARRCDILAGWQIYDHLTIPRSPTTWKIIIRCVRGPSNDLQSWPPKVNKSHA